MEVLICKDVSAKEFLTRQYGEIARLGGSIAMSSDGISIFFKLGLSGCVKRLRELTKRVLAIVEGINIDSNELDFEYAGSRFIPYG